MSDLLKRFVELAPKDWGAIERETLGHRYVLFITDGLGLCGKYNPTKSGALHIDNDIASAEAIVFLWRYLEKEGLWFSVGGTRHHGDEPTYGAPYVVVGAELLRPIGKGMTIIEALVRACVAYWEANGVGR